MIKDLLPENITLETLKRLKREVGYDAYEKALKARKDWIERQRDRDRKEARLIQSKVYQHKLKVENPELFLERKRNYRRKVTLKSRGYRGSWYKKMPTRKYVLSLGTDGEGSYQNLFVYQRLSQKGEVDNHFYMSYQGNKKIEAER